MVKIEFSEVSDFDFKDMTLVDMHCHTTYSDGLDSAETLIQRAKQLKIGLSITDHNTVRGTLKIGTSLFSIPGIEVTSLDSIDFLFYFYTLKDLIEFHDRYVKDNVLKFKGFNYRKLNIETLHLLDLARNYNAVVVLPHPFTMRPKNSFIFMSKHRELLNYVDGIEVINSIMTLESNSKAITWANGLDLAATGGSDAHLVKHLGNVVTASYANTVEDFLDTILKKKNFVVGTPVRGVERLKTKISIFRSNYQW